MKRRDHSTAVAFTDLVTRGERTPQPIHYFQRYRGKDTTLGDLLHPRRQVGRVPERSVVHPQIVADLPDHHLSRVEAHSHREADPLADAQLIRVATQRIAKVKSGLTSSLRVVFVRNWCAEECHDAVTAILVDRTLEAVNAFGQDLEEVNHDAVPFLGVEFGGQLRRALHVGKQNCHLLALALEGGAEG
jgi:hypothetical protein